MSRVILGDVATERRETCKGSKEGYPIVGLEHLTPEEITLDAWDEEKENTFTKLFYKDDILFGRRRAYLKKAAVAPFDGICSGDITVIKANPERIVPELLPFIIQNDTLFNFAVGKSAGSLSPRVNWENLKNFEFALPDLEKQYELTKLLWLIYATKKTYKKLLQKTDELVKAQFIEQFGDLDTVQLKEIATISAGQSSPYDEEFSVVGTPFIKAGNLEALKLGKYTEKGCNLVSQNTIQKRKLKLQKPGTVLIAKSGMSCLSGHVYALKESAYVVSHLACIAPIDEKGVTDFIRCFFITYGTKDLIRDPSYPSIQLGKFSEMQIPNVSYNNQLKFAEFVRQSDKSKFELEQALKELNATYKKLINENFG